MLTIDGISQKSGEVNFPMNSATKQIGFITNLNTTKLALAQKGVVGIKTNQSSLFLSIKKNSTKITFKVPNATEVLASGINTKTRSKNKVEWQFDASKENYYKLYIATASDSAKNFIVYSGYLYFPSINKWKLIGSFRINGTTESISNTNAFKSSAVATNVEELFTDSWSQGDNGSWNKVQNTSIQKPMVLPMSDLDSTARAIKDSIEIQSLISSGQTDAKEYKNGLYKTLLKSSTKSEIVHITDTVTIFYKGYFMGTDIVFDQTSKEPRTFPLGRLIKGWQVGLEGTKVGEKVKLLIPSGLAYGIRTRSPLISPNSILVFEIESIETKPNIKL